MFTPQEVQNQKFEKAVFGGYDMATVDDFLEQLTADYTNLYKENAVLKNKLKVLVDSLEEYRSVDDSMRKTLLTAQKMASQTVDEAKAEAQKIIADAEDAAVKRKQQAVAEAEAEETRLEQAKGRTAEFLADMSKRLEAHLIDLNRLTEKVDVKPIEVTRPQPQNISEAAEEIENVVAKKLEMEELQQEEDMDDTKKFEREEKAPVSEATTRIDLSNLEFGNQYNGPAK